MKAGIAAAGGLVAVEALPDPAKYSNALKKGTPTGRLLSMSVNYISLNIGPTRPFSIFHISDTHLKATTDADPQFVRDFVENRFAGWDPEDALARSIAWAKFHRSDYVLHTGDLIDCATEGNLAIIRKYFGENANLLYAPGNHDYATTYAAPRNGQTEAEFRAVNTKRVQASVPVDMSFNSRIVNGVNIVMLDNVYGTVSEEKFERFRAEAAKGLPIILAMHVPFFTEGIARAHDRAGGGPYPFEQNVVRAPGGNHRTQCTDKTTAAFIAYLKKEPLLKAILSGHFHISVSDRFSPTAVQYVAAANFRYFGQEVLIF